MQQIKFDVPDNIIILTKEQHQELLDQIDDSVWISFREVQDYTGLGRNKLTDILKWYRHELDVENGGPVKYPDNGHWSFEKEGTKKWLKENHSRVWKEVK